MAKTILAAYQALRSRLATISGLNNAPEYPTENITKFPALEMDPISGKWTNFTVAGQPMGEHSFKFKVHVNRAQGLPKAAAELLPFAERVANALMYDNYRLGDTVDSIVSLNYDEKPTKYAEVSTLCFDFELIVKIMGVGE